MAFRPPLAGMGIDSALTMMYGDGGSLGDHAGDPTMSESARGVVSALLQEGLDLWRSTTIRVSRRFRICLHHVFHTSLVMIAGH